MKAWTAHDQDTSLQCCRTLHVKHAAYASALYTLVSINKSQYGNEMLAAKCSMGGSGGQAYIFADRGSVLYLNLESTGDMCKIEFP